MNNIIQLKITLQDTKPPIWRQILVDKSATFSELHHIIQIAMGWQNCHLFEFNINGNKIAAPNKEIDMGYEVKSMDASTLTLGSVIKSTGERFEYEYDFGDGWEHWILVEKFLPRDKNTRYQLCIDGKLNCPPEDCGGTYGFYNMLKIIKSKKHPEHKEMLEWLGGTYDKEHFDVESVNEELLSLDEYIRDSSNTN